MIIKSGFGIYLQYSMEYKDNLMNGEELRYSIKNNKHTLTYKCNNVDNLKHGTFINYTSGGNV